MVCSCSLAQCQARLDHFLLTLCSHGPAASCPRLCRSVCAVASLLCAWNALVRDAPVCVSVCCWRHPRVVPPFPICPGSFVGQCCWLPVHSKLCWPWLWLHSTSPCSRLSEVSHLVDRRTHGDNLQWELGQSVGRRVGVLDSETLSSDLDLTSLLTPILHVQFVKKLRFMTSKRCKHFFREFQSGNMLQ